MSRQKARPRELLETVRWAYRRSDRVQEILNRMEVKEARDWHRVFAMVDYRRHYSAFGDLARRALKELGWTVLCLQGEFHLRRIADIRKKIRPQERVTLVDDDEWVNRMVDKYWRADRVVEE